MTPTTTGATPETLRARMVDHIRDAGHARSDVVEQALRDVPRHEFVPAAPLEDAYADIAVITKTASDGAALSCASVPTVVAMMLDQLDIQPGHRVLEIGAGTGYNAALLTHLTGTGGQVATVDIDPDVTAHARQALDATGHRDVQVITADGSLGAAERAPFDRIIVTAGAWDIPPAWWHQLAPGGRLVVPLRWRGQTRSVAFAHHGHQLVADSLHLCGFVPLLGQEGESTAYLDSDRQVSLTWDADQGIHPDALRGVLSGPFPLRPRPRGGQESRSAARNHSTVYGYCSPPLRPKPAASPPNPTRWNPDYVRSPCRPGARHSSPTTPWPTSPCAATPSQADGNSAPTDTGRTAPPWPSASARASAPGMTPATPDQPSSPTPPTHRRPTASARASSPSDTADSASATETRQPTGARPAIGTSRRDPRPTGDHGPAQ